MLQTEILNHLNRRIVLNARPAGAPIAKDFRMEERVVPALLPEQVLLRTIYLSLDPYMRGRMSDAPSYAAPTAIDEVMGGATVSRVVASQHSQFKAGDLVLGFSGWQKYAVTDVVGLTKLDAKMPRPSLTLGVLGMPGFTAYMGLLDIGRPEPMDTVVVAAASGAVGSVVGQIAKLKGCRVVGIAGGDKKCRYVVDELGFDACIDHHRTDFPQLLALACMQGIDVYFENVGGAVFDAVLPLLNERARVPLCGLISSYNQRDSQNDRQSKSHNQDVMPEGSDRMGKLMRTLLSKRIKLQGFIISADYGSRFSEFVSQMSTWVQDGRIKFREDIVDGLENAPEAFIGLLEGKNFGKLIIRVSSE
jgi:NADPH-dependent curcumin reductase